MKPYIEEIEKRFDELEKSLEPPSISERLTHADVVALQENIESIKAFVLKEILPSLLSKFAAKINGEKVEHLDTSPRFVNGKDMWGEDYAMGERLRTDAYNAHHRSVAEKADEIIKQLQ
jgi:hypothetical protein